MNYNVLLCVRIVLVTWKSTKWQAKQRKIAHSKESDFQSEDSQDGYLEALPFYI